MTTPMTTSHTYLLDEMSYGGPETSNHLHVSVVACGMELVLQPLLGAVRQSTLQHQAMKSVWSKEVLENVTPLLLLLLLLLFLP